MTFDATNQVVSNSDDAYTGKSRRKTKVDRYDWSEIVGKPGVLSWVKPGDLYIDPTYQRGYVEEKVIAIARDFSWPAFGIVVLAERTDGVLAVLDGQNRVMAARRRADVLTIPAIVFADMDVTDEARAFLAMNDKRKPLTYWDKVKPKLVLGDPATVLVHDLARAYGREIRPGDIDCARRLTRLAETDPDRLRAMWPLIMELTVGTRVHERLIAAIMYIEKRMPPGESLNDDRWRKRLRALGASGIVQAAAQGAVFFAHGGDRAWATGVVQAINKGQIKHRIVLIGSENETAKTEH